MSTLIFDNHTSLVRDRFPPGAKMLRRKNSVGRKALKTRNFIQSLSFAAEQIVIDGWPKTTHTSIEHCFFAGSHAGATTYRPDKMKVEARDCSPPTFRSEHNLNGDEFLLQTIYKFSFNYSCAVRGGCVKRFALNLFDVIIVGAAAAYASSHAVVHAIFIK